MNFNDKNFVENCRTFYGYADVIPGATVQYSVVSSTEKCYSTSASLYAILAVTLFFFGTLLFAVKVLNLKR
jgi:hypothetical protein